MSIPNSLLQLWAARLASKIAICSAMTYDLYYMSKARGKEGSMKLAVCDDSKRWLYRTNSVVRKDERGVEDVFVECLIAAGRCGHRVQRKRNLVCEGSVRTHSGQDERARMRRPMGPMFVRELSTQSRRQQDASAALSDPTLTQEEVTSLVNTYELPSDMWEPSEAPTSQLATPPHPRLAPRLVVPPSREDLHPQTARRLILKPEGPSQIKALSHFRRLLFRTTGEISQSHLWAAYETLPTPRPRYLTNNDIRQTFRHLTWVEHKFLPGAMQRYFGFLEECLAEGVYLKTREWNTATAFAGRWVQGVTSQEVKDAIGTWMWMEKSGHQADNVTFNILFDVAVRAGRFALADTIFGELKARNMVLDRYFRTSMIYYYGIRRDGEGVRQAFRDLVSQGEIVDTVIMNCVILSLIRAGEPEAAENVFARMKTLLEEKLGGKSVKGWRESKVLGQLLQDTATKLREEKEVHEKSFFGSSAFPFEERKEKVQRITPIAPDARTYRILIQHHAYRSGDLARIDVLLKEMREQGFHVRGSLYVYLFRGFWLHGGMAFSAWNARALRDVWEEFLQGIEDGRREEEAAAGYGASDSASSASSDSGYDSDRSRRDSVTEADRDAGEDEMPAPLMSEEDKNPFFTKTAVKIALMAWYKCAGRKRMLEVWEEVKELWRDMSEDDRMVLAGIVERLDREGSIYVEVK